MMIEDRKVVTLNGTGFSAAVATGVVALVIAANKDLSPKEIKDILITTADKSDNGPPMLNLKNAVALAAGLKGRIIAYKDLANGISLYPKTSNVKGVEIAVIGTNKDIDTAYMVLSSPKNDIGIVSIKVPFGAHCTSSYIIMRIGDIIMRKQAGIIDGKVYVSEKLASRLAYDPVKMAVEKAKEAGITFIVGKKV